MDRERAEELLNSPAKIEVHFQGKPVWIEGVEETTANVSVMGTCRTMKVPFTELEEK